MQTFEICLDRVLVSTKGLTDAEIHEVAHHHFETGDCVWHSVHVALETPKCNCANCNKPMVSRPVIVNDFAESVG